MTQPKILMLDEPTAGVSPIVMDELFDRIIDMNTGVAIVAVDKNAKQALQIADIGSYWYRVKINFQIRVKLF